MLNLLDKLLKKKQSSEPGIIKCLCGEEVVKIDCGKKKKVYFCGKCNKLLYYLDAEGISKPESSGLSIFKKKNRE